MPKAQHPLQWIVDPLEGVPGYTAKNMFGCRGCYVSHTLVIVLCDGEPPWNGLLVPTDRSMHEALMADFPSLAPHQVLGKWLYIAQDAPGFEDTAGAIVELVIQGDPRIGVESKRKVKQIKRPPKKAAKKTAKKARPKA